MATDTIPVAKDAPPLPSPGQRLLLTGITWESYLQIAEALDGHRVRLTYDDGALEFMTISSEHGYLSRLLAQMVVILSDECDVPRRSVGDMTCQQPEFEKALEPDECYYIANEERDRGRTRIDFTVDPPPDLAIEVDLSPPKLARTGIYHALRVPELWQFRGDLLQVRYWQPEDYRDATESLSFPGLTVADLTQFLERRHATDERSLMREFREWVQENLCKD